MPPPLTGKKIVIARSGDAPLSGVARLTAAGGEVVELFVARPVHPESWEGLDAALGRLLSFDWIAFTSVNAVRYVVQRLDGKRHRASDLICCRLAAIGPATAKALADHDLFVTLEPDHHDATALAEAILALSPKPRVLLPQADNASPVLADHLRAAGGTVTTAIAYRMLLLPFAVNQAAGAAAVLVTSSATAERFAAGLGPEALRRLVDGGCRFYAIGPQTAETLVKLGIPVNAVADHGGGDGLVDAALKDLR